MPVFNTQGAVVNSPGWVRARIGCLTASNMWKAMDFRKDGKPSAERIKYMREIVAERMIDAAVDHYVSEAMEHGLEYEDEAKAVYSELSGHLLTPTEFILHPTIEFCGATPDALIGSDGLLEVKCPLTTTFIAWKVAGAVPTQHIPQMTLQLACTRRKWCDFMAYDPRIKVGAKYFVRRFEPKPEEIKAVEEAAIQFLMEVEQMFDALTMKETA